MELKLIEMLISGGGSAIMVALLIGPFMLLVAVLFWLAKFHFPSQQKLLRETWDHHDRNWQQLSSDIRLSNRISLATTIAQMESKSIDEAMLKAERYIQNGGHKK
jgi:hypothetical protein